MPTPIAFKNGGADYELDYDGSVRKNHTPFGSWTTDDDNALVISPTDGSASIKQVAQWSMSNGTLRVTPTAAAAVDLLAGTEGNIEFRLEHNQLVVDPDTTDAFAFTLAGTWELSADRKQIKLTLNTTKDVLPFEGGLHDSNSRFSWFYEATSGAIAKHFTLAFEGNWKLVPNPVGTPTDGVVLSSFSFSYTVGNESLDATFAIPVSVGTDGQNKLLLSYKHEGSADTWAVAFAGKFKTKGGSVIGYTAELYGNDGKISSSFSFDFKGKPKDKSQAAANWLHFECLIAGKSVTLKLTGGATIGSTKVQIDFALNTASKTSGKPAITLGITAASPTNGTTVDFKLTVDGSIVTVSLQIGTDIRLGPSRKGTVWAKLDFNYNGKTYGVDAVFGVNLT